MDGVPISAAIWWGQNLCKQHESMDLFCLESTVSAAVTVWQISRHTRFSSVYLSFSGKLFPHSVQPREHSWSQRQDSNIPTYTHRHTHIHPTHYNLLSDLFILAIALGMKLLLNLTFLQASDQVAVARWKECEVWVKWGWLGSSAMVCPLCAVAVLTRCERLGVGSPMILAALRVTCASLFFLGADSMLKKKGDQ